MACGNRWVKLFTVSILIAAVLVGQSAAGFAVATAYASPPPVDFQDSGLITNHAAAFERLLSTWGFGYFPLDGRWTDKDAYALKLFQRWVGLPATGLADDATRGRLRVVWDQYGNAAIRRQKLPLEGRYIGINPGHQSCKDTTVEAVSPDPESPKKHSVSVGTCGRYTHVPEYNLNLTVALKVRDALESSGAMVYMVRTTNDVKIGNAKRCILMNAAGVDLALVIHADGNENSTVKGLHVLQPAERGYQRGAVLRNSRLFADIMLAQEIEHTGAASLGMSTRWDLLSFNWSKSPVCLVEMGFMTSKTEDLLLNTNAYQHKIVSGMVEGIRLYFEARDQDRKKQPIF